MDPEEREFFIDNLLVRIHLIIDMVLVDRPDAMGVWILFFSEPYIVISVDRPCAMGL